MFGEDHFSNLLKTMYKLENELEIERQQLILQCVDFTIGQGFKLFKPPQDHAVGMGWSNVQSAFKTLGITISSAHAKLLVKRFDTDLDDRLTYMNVVSFFVPQDSFLYNAI